MPDPYLRTKTHRKKNGEVVTYEYWEGEWTDADGRRRRGSLGNKEVIKTLAAARKVLDAKIGENKQPVAESLTVAEWTERYIASMDCSQATRDQYKLARANAIDCWGVSKRLRDVTGSDVKALVKHIRESRTKGGDARLHDYSIRNRCLSLKAMFAEATVLPDEKRPYLRSNPFVFSKKNPIPNPKQAASFTPVTLKQTADLLTECPDNNWKALVALTRLCGMRLAEALHVTASDINWSKRFIAVELRDDRIGRGDGSKQKKRKVPIFDPAYAILNARFLELGDGDSTLIDATPLNKGTRQKPQDHMRRIMERAGILNVNKPFHDMRKSCAAEWATLWGTERSARWCGHSINVATKHYRSDDEDDFAEVTGLGDPKAKLAAEYKVLEQAVLGSNA